MAKASSSKRLRKGKKVAPTAVVQPYSTLLFYQEDFGRTLFPLKTNRIVIENGEPEINLFLDGCKAGTQSFLPQTRVYASKDARHLRRTVKLDPVAEYFIYDLVYRNRANFKKPHRKDFRHYGYRFENGRPISPSASYAEFKLEVWLAYMFAEHNIAFDVSTYFNSVYHHDLVAWLANIGAEADDVETFSKFLRETNSGRSVDCLPHGLYPTKMIGNDFLRFVEDSAFLKSEKVIRFLDDFHIFSDDLNAIEEDFYHIQKILGLKGLSVNPAKTVVDELDIDKAEDDITDVKKQLLKRRRTIVERSSYDAINDDDDDGDDDDQEVEQLPLTPEELQAIHDILKNDKIQEDDAELILVVMRNNSEDVLEYLPGMIEKFPHLAKSIFAFCKSLSDHGKVADMLISVLKSDIRLAEFQLFWFGMMLDEYLLATPGAGTLVQLLLTHPNATDITSAKILETSESRFGLPEIRAEHLRSGRSDWLSLSSAAGCRDVKKAARNYALEYFMKSSPMNELIGSVLQKLP